MIITQDHIEKLIYLFKTKEGSDNTILVEILTCINIKRKGRWENTSYIFDTNKQQLVVKEDD